MKNNSKPFFYYKYLILFVFIGNISIAQIVPYDSDLIKGNYSKEIVIHRTKEEKSFKNKETTLLSDDYFARFTGLNYFPVNLKYRVVANLTRSDDPKRRDLEMTFGNPYGFVHFGKVNFYLDGESIELDVYEFPSREYSTAIFVPFTDLTTGNENFGGGRFVIINIPKEDQIVIDFNLAINPICVYDPSHSCPIPPESNFINKQILAGAKMYYDPEAMSLQN